MDQVHSRLDSDLFCLFPTNFFPRLTYQSGILSWQQYTPVTLPRESPFRHNPTLTIAEITIPEEDFEINLKPHDRLDHYEILQELRRTNLGVVYKARDTTLQRIVAIQVLDSQLARQTEARERFIREAKTATTVRGEHVVPVFGVGGIEANPYLVMAYVPGFSLQQRLEQKEPLPVADILRLGQYLARGLAEAHAQNVIHGNLQPANILFPNADGGSRLAVWSEKIKPPITAALRPLQSPIPKITDFGLVVGNPSMPEYFSPEQAAGEELDSRTDLFSLGSILYALCTGQVPFHGNSPQDVSQKVREEEPIWIKELNPKIPNELIALIARLQAKHPGDRPQTAVEVAVLFGLLQERRQTRPLRPKFIPKRLTWRQRCWWWKWLLAGGLVLALLWPLLVHTLFD